MFKIKQKDGAIVPLTDKKLIDTLYRDTRIFTLVKGDLGIEEVKKPVKAPKPVEAHKVSKQPEVAKKDPLAAARAAKAAKRKAKLEEAE